jgi:hypothetical protein
LAYWDRKRGKQVVVYVWEDGKQKQLPRDKTRHLDVEPDHNIEAWVARYSEQFEGKALQPEQITPAKMIRWVDGYTGYLESRGKSAKTVGDHRRMLNNYIIPYFVGLHGMEDPNKWPAVSAQLDTYMREVGDDADEESSGMEHQILRTNSAIRGFWEWLADEHHVLGGVALRVRKPRPRDAATPLPRVVTPDEVLKFVKGCRDRDIKLMALLGFFFSLRPQETFALRIGDFVAGSKAVELEACRVMSGHKVRGGDALYGRLAVHITRQRIQSGEFREPKAYSRGYVSCFSEEAAKLLVAILKTPDPDIVRQKAQKEKGERTRGNKNADIILGWSSDYNFAKWHRQGLGAGVEGRRQAELSLKDLRRASIYWLGHYTTLELNALKNHARHKKADTTMLYLRRPEDIEPGTAWDRLDLDA